MCARLYKPQRVSHNRVFVACHLLLLPPPLRQLDLVRKKITSSQRVSQPKMCTQRPQAFGRLLVPPITFHNFKIPIIIGVTCEAGHTIRAHFVLEIDVRDGRPDIV